MRFVHIVRLAHDRTNRKRFRRHRQLSPIVRAVILPGPDANRSFCSGPGRPSSPRATTGTAGAVPLAAPATSSSESASALVSGAQGISCVHTEDGTVILFDRLTGRAVSALTKVAAEAALRRLAAGSVPVAGAGSVPVASTA